VAVPAFHRQSGLRTFWTSAATVGAVPPPHRMIVVRQIFRRVRAGGQAAGRIVGIHESARHTAAGRRFALGSVSVSQSHLVSRAGTPVAGLMV